MAHHGHDAPPSVKRDRAFRGAFFRVAFFLVPPAAGAGAFIKRLTASSKAGEVCSRMSWATGVLGVSRAVRFPSLPST